MLKTRRSAATTDQDVKTKEKDDTSTSHWKALETAINALKTAINAVKTAINAVKTAINAVSD